MGSGLPGAMLLVLLPFITPTIATRPKSDSTIALTGSLFTFYRLLTTEIWEHINCKANKANNILLPY
eukprot:868866-Heterocapsa_arctica.AAC.1